MEANHFKIHNKNNPNAMASKKKDVPSKENGIPIIGPAWSINFGHNSPNSNDRTVPETAPTAKKMASPRDQAFAKSRYTCLPVLIHWMNN